MPPRAILLAAILLPLAWTRAASLGPPKDIAFKAALDGSTERYVEVLPEPFDPAQEHHVLIALHGHGSDRWQYVRDPRGECRGARDVAAKHGMIFLSPDYRAKTSWMGPKAEADVVQIIAEVRQRHKVGKVFLVGGSMGGTAALTFAALHPDLIAGVSSQNGTANLIEYESFQDAIAASFGGTKKAIPEEYRKRSAEFHADALTMPIAFTVGGKDTLVPPQSVLRLAEALNQRKRDVLLICRENGGHSTDYADTVAALEFVLSRALLRK